MSGPLIRQKTCWWLDPSSKLIKPFIKKGKIKLTISRLKETGDMLNWPARFGVLEPPLCSLQFFFATTWFLRIIVSLWPSTKWCESEGPVCWLQQVPPAQGWCVWTKLHLNREYWSYDPAACSSVASLVTKAQIVCVRMRIVIVEFGTTIYWFA